MQSDLPPFSCTHTPEMPELLSQLGISLLVSTYQAGKVIAISSDGEKLIQLPRTFDTPMGLALEGRRLAVATKHEVVLLANEPQLAASYPKQPGQYDALFVPTSARFCGRLNVHDMAWTPDGLIGVNTLFSCLFRLDDEYSFVPIWKPPFIAELTPDDRCHLNGMAVVEGRAKYTTSLGEVDERQGWRSNKLAGGTLMDVATDEIVLRGLAMPHTPRIYDGELFLLLSATGELVTVDTAAGTTEVVTRMPGFVRGMTRAGDYLFIGSSHLRKSHTFGDLPLAQEQTMCGVAVVHLGTGALVGNIRYVNSCEEIYDVQVLPGLRRPNILGTRDPVFRRALTMPEATYWGEEEDPAEYLARAQQTAGQ